MRCENVRDSFSPWMDGELAPIEQEAVREHLASCPDCRADIAIWEEISSSLKTMNQTYTAPAGFSAAVINQLQSPGRQRWFSTQTFKKWAASAAAVVILAAGSAGLALNNWGGLVPRVVETPPGQFTVADNPDVKPAPEQGSSEAAAPGTNNTLPPVQNSENSEDPDNPGASESPDISSNDAGISTPTEPLEPLTVAQAEVQPKVFLSKERVITTTMLKLRVSDAKAAYTQASAIGKDFSASSQVLAQQAGTRYVTKYVVPADKVESFLGELGRLGTTSEQVTDTQNVTSNFADTMEEYSAVIAQINSTEDEKQRKNLKNRASYLENLLSAWNNEAEKRVVVLWLEH